MYSLDIKDNFKSLKNIYSQSTNSHGHDNSDPLPGRDMTASKPGTCQDITVIPDMGADSYGADLEHGVREGEQGEEAGEMRKPFR